MRVRPEGAAGWALSALLHGALFAGLAAVRPPPRSRGAAVDVEIREVAPPPRAEPPPPSPRAAPRRVAVSRPARRDLPPPPLAPPPDQPPPADAAPPARARIRVGVSLSATTSAGGVAAPVGGTLYGRAPERAPDPAEVKPYRAGRYAAPTEVSSLPRTISCDVPREEYPAEAREAGLEGTVRVRLLVDEEGRVQEATPLADPGKGLGPAAATAARRHCRFRPALRDGQPVATEIVFTFVFDLR